MDANAALLAGLVAGIAVAIQVGAVSLLLIEAALVAGPRAGVAAGMGVATADLAFAAVAAGAGGAAGAVLSSHETEIRLVAAGAVAAIAIHGMLALRRGGELVPAATANAHEEVGDRGTAWRHYGRFLTITAANPLTIASFAAVATSLSLAGPIAGAAFAIGAGAASAGWHLVLTLAAGHARRCITPRTRRRLAIGGRIVLLAIAAHLALAA
jgi:threonine/homoserine/homoserine lactone efflux protein